MNPAEIPATPDAVPDEGPVDNSFGDILTQFEQSHHARGESLEGTVVSVTAEGVFVDIGRKNDGVLPIDPKIALKPGMKVVVSIRGRDQEGTYQLSTIRVDGLMTMAPIVESQDQARPVFASLRHLRDALRARFPNLALPHLSMGMSDDFEAAIAEGSTMVRIGRTIFGTR